MSQDSEIDALVLNNQENTPSVNPCKARGTLLVISVTIRIFGMDSRSRRRQRQAIYDLLPQGPLDPLYAVAEEAEDHLDAAQNGNAAPNPLIGQNAILIPPSNNGEGNLINSPLRRANVEVLLPPDENRVVLDRLEANLDDDDDVEADERRAEHDDSGVHRWNLAMQTQFSPNLTLAEHICQVFVITSVGASKASDLKGILDSHMLTGYPLPRNYPKNPVAFDKVCFLVPLDTIYLLFLPFWFGF